MILNHLKIKNFRNFEAIELNLTNKNVVFGLNDIGKSNFLAAIRFLLDINIRRNGFVESDFYNRCTDREIEITLKIEISDFTNDDNKMIRTMMKGAIPSNEDFIFIQVKSTYNPDVLLGDPIMSWGVNYNRLESIPSTQTRYALDNFFNIVYIDSSIKLDNTFKWYSKEIFKKESSITPDEKKKLDSSIKNLNSSIRKLETVKSFESEILDEYRKFRDEKNLKIQIESEIDISNVYSKLTPYIQDEKSQNYPTSGDGRRKLLAYTLVTLENRKIEKKRINVFLIEELENHFHRSMQIALSYELFNDALFRHLFITTHSSLIVSQMDNVNLIKLYKECKVTGKSHVYVVPPEYKKMKQKLNQNLAEAIYADYVLLVEGPSEKVLFDRILVDKCPKYESLGGYILEVDGINFREYYSVLKALGISIIAKTDNDIQKVKSKDLYLLTGFNRCLGLIDKSITIHMSGLDFKKYESDSTYSVDIKRTNYDRATHIRKRLNDNQVYLSRVDLENDLYEAIPGVLNNLASKNGSKKSGVDFLQSAKLVNTIELCKDMTSYSVNKIYAHEHFQCIRKLVELCNQ